MKEDVWQEIRTRLTERRKMLGMSQSEVAHRMGQPSWQSTLSAIENGRMGPPKFDILVKWARALRMTARAGILLGCPEWPENFFADLTPTTDETQNGPR